MLPIAGKPAIQWVVEEAVRAGITDILVITSRNKGPIEDHFDSTPELESRLESSGKAALLEEMRAISDLANVHFIRQGEAKGLGHAVATARHHVGDQPFAVLLPDDVMLPSSTVLADMVATFGQSDRGVVAFKEVPHERISSYGCARFSERNGNVIRLSEIVEKPALSAAPSNLAVIGRYVLPPEVFAILETTAPGAGGEIQLTDALATLLAGPGLDGWTFEAGHYDIGNTPGLVQANVGFGVHDPALGADIRALVETELRQ